MDEDNVNKDADKTALSIKELLLASDRVRRYLDQLLS